jgi:drug/metabolite transporter (DMT)-like permease
VFYLLTVSLLWAFSFGLVKGQLAGIDAVAISVIRLVFALLTFLPGMKLKGVGMKLRWKLTMIGALQFGVMYMLYLGSFNYLKAYEVALSTIFTPLYIVLIDALLERKWQWRFLLAAAVALVGTLIVIKDSAMTPSRWTGFLMMQGANLCFALGQLAWRKVHLELDALKLSDAQLFALPYAGALMVCFVVSLFITDWRAFHPSLLQWIIIAYLGVLASGLCFFWWNRGAERVNAGALAVMNNIKLPLGIAVSLIVFGEKTNLPQLIVGCLIIASGLWFSGRDPKPQIKAPQDRS